VSFKIFFLLLLITNFFLPTNALAKEGDLSFARQKMVQEQLKARDITDQKLLEVMARLKRELFVSKNLQALAYEDGPLPIGYGQTISQPYIVAYMTQAVQLKPDDRVLEVGTGSGYQAAILAEIAKEVYTIEILKPLADSARSRLEGMGYRNIKVKCGDGYKGWKEFAPFDVIIVTAAPPHMPQELVNQLKIGGRMVVPIGDFFQELYLVTKTEKGIEKEALLPVRFVPMIHSK
jgi:protein-L-isoaspartate(D-aspartate) O-methyltransferase